MRTSNSLSFEYNAAGVLKLLRKWRRDLFIHSVLPIGAGDGSHEAAVRRQGPRRCFSSDASTVRSRAWNASELGRGLVQPSIGSNSFSSRADHIALLSDRAGCDHLGKGTILSRQSSPPGDSRSRWRRKKNSRKH